MRFFLEKLRFEPQVRMGFVVRVQLALWSWLHVKAEEMSAKRKGRRSRSIVSESMFGGAPCADLSFFL